AAGSGGIKVVRELLAAGANVNARAADGCTALHAAAVERDVQIVELLLAAGADVNARTKDDITPLMCSIGSPYSDPTVGLALIRAGADVNIVDSQGHTALWDAATSGAPEELEEILKKGADPNVRYPPSTGNTPLHIAALN